MESFSRLPNVFTRDDVARCYGIKNVDTVRKKVQRLENEGAVTKIVDKDNHVMYKKVRQILD